MEILFFERIDSTQRRLVEGLQKGEVTPPIAYATRDQYAGVGSRGNSWIGARGNLFFSFAIDRGSLVQDLPLASSSIYFGFLFKESLAQAGSKVWLKWPNDLFLERKVGGCITQLVGSSLVCGIGLNLLHAPANFDPLDISIEAEELLERYFSLIESKPSWKEVFSKFRVEFAKSRPHMVHHKGTLFDLRDAQLAEDGAIIIGGERIYSLR
ncbi:MAG: biotin--[acetyl-CoA-carboxylase] ligase [Nitratiruptor sp.]|nr:biotin--[acetyl-CoA-carboxylase] ligase [Nitratiruptor sp.]NPA84009.1 biotin--[acetyl-CoA-carboxylase] ligase [Campylobacterota bacterium]